MALVCPLCRSLNFSIFNSFNFILIRYIRENNFWFRRISFTLSYHIYILFYKIPSSFHLRLVILSFSSFWRKSKTMTNIFYFLLPCFIYHVFIIISIFWYSLALNCYWDVIYFIRNWSYTTHLRRTHFYKLTWFNLLMIIMFSNILFLIIYLFF